MHLFLICIFALADVRPPPNPAGVPEAGAPPPTTLEFPGPLAAPTSAPPPRPVPAGKRLVGLKRVGVVVVADGPKSLEFLPDGKRVWTNNLYGNKTQLIDAQKLEVLSTYTMPGEPVEVDFSRDAKTAWVSLYDKDQLLAVEVDTGKVKATIPTGVIPKVTAVSPDSRWVYVANWGHEPPIEGEKWWVTVVDALAMKAVKNIPVIRIPRGIVFTPDGKYAYIANMGADHFTKVDVNNDHTVVGEPIVIGRNPRHVVSTRDGKLFYISLNLGKKILKYDVATDKVIAETPTTSRPRTIELSADERYLFACIYDDNQLLVLDATDLKVLFTVPTDVHPIGVAVAPDGRRVWVANYSTRPSTLWVFDTVFEGETTAAALP